MNFDMDLISKLLEQLLMATVPVVAVFVVQLLLAKISDAKASVAAENRWLIQFGVNMAVRAAEQVLGAGNGAQKKEHAIRAAEAYLQSQGISLDVSALDAAIEAEVFSVFNFWLEEIDD